MSSKGHTKKVMDRINGLTSGHPFIPSDFSDIADAHTIRRILQRAVDSGEIDRVMRGVYVKPEWSSLLNRKVSPSADSIAHTIARGKGWTIAPNGNSALNLLGLSTQVPAVWTYVSDGPYAEYDYGKIKIQFKHTANKDSTGMSSTSALVVQALKAIGKENVDMPMLEKISARLSKDEYRTLLAETERTTAWVRSAILKMNDIGGWDK